MYEEEQCLPLPQMYGKNLIFKTGGVDAIHGERLMSLIAQGKLNTDYLISRRSPLNDILEAYRIFAARQEPILKWVVTPYVR